MIKQWLPKLSRLVDFLLLATILICSAVLCAVWLTREPMSLGEDARVAARLIGAIPARWAEEAVDGYRIEVVITGGSYAVRLRPVGKKRFPHFFSEKPGTVRWGLDNADENSVIF